MSDNQAYMIERLQRLLNEVEDENESLRKMLEYPTDVQEVINNLSERVADLTAARNMVAEKRDELARQLEYRKANPLHCVAAHIGEVTGECNAQKPCNPCCVKMQIERLQEDAQKKHELLNLMRSDFIAEVEAVPEPLAGIVGYTDTVRVSSDTGMFGGEAGEFAEYLRDFLAQWYDGARVQVFAPDTERDGIYGRKKYER